MSKKGLAVSALLALPLIGFLVWQEASPESFVTTFGIDGTLEATALSDGKLVLFEKVARKSHKGPNYRVWRMQVLDANTGAVTGGPWLAQNQRWLGTAGGLAITVRDGAIEGRSISTGEVTVTPAKLESLSPEIAGHLDPATANYGLDDGRLSFSTNQGRSFVVDPAGPALVEARGLPTEPPRAARPRWQTVGNGQRRSFTGQEPSLLMPEWLDDSQTRGPIAVGAGGWLVRHFDRVGPSGGEGLILSAIDANGAESWRHTLPTGSRVRAAFGAGPRVLCVVEAPEAWGVEALDRATGKVAWSLHPPAP